ncbi:MAG: fimbria/pilus outer membrane usher protein [Gammaproteobacteria bacterium]
MTKFSNINIAQLLRNATFLWLGSLLSIKGALAQPLFLDIYLNKQETGYSELLLSRPDGLWLTQATLDKLNFKPSTEKPILDKEIKYYPLSGFKGVSYQLKKQDLAVDIVTHPSALKTQEIHLGKPASVPPIERTRGGFFNYDLSSTILEGQSKQIGGVFEGGYFNNYGVGTASWLVRRSYPPVDRGNQTTRLQTQWAYDDVERMRVVRVGDAVTQPPSWSQPVLFGGVQWATNFETKPGFLRYPLPATTGSAVIPTSVDLYLNNALLSKQDLQSGPFVINNIPVVTGGGMLQVVTTDLLGRQQITSMPFYVSPLLLKPGLHNYSFSGGMIRNDYGTQSNHYGSAFFSATDTVGLSNQLTGQFHGEITAKQQAAGIGGNFVYTPWGVFSTAIAGSRSSARGNGWLGQVGFQRQMQNRVSFGANAQVTTANFMRLGMSDTQWLPSFQSQIFTGIPLKDGSSIGLSYTVRNNRERDKARLVSASYGRGIGKQWFFSVSAFKDMEGQKQQAVFLSAMYVFDKHMTANVSMNKQKDSMQSAAQVSRALPAGGGYGYSLSARQSDSQNQDYEGTLSMQSNIGNYTAQIEQQSKGQRNYRLGARGGIAFMGGDAYLSRQITGSFGVLQVPGRSNVKVYLFNQEVAKTNKQGNALLPNLLPYQVNKIHIDPIDLPLDMHFENTSFDSIPYYRSGILLTLNANTSKSAIMQLVLPSGEPLPVGALVALQDNQAEYFPVAQNGRTFVVGLKEGKNKLLGLWDNKQCMAEIALVKTTDLIPDLGTAICNSLPLS